MSRFPTAGHLLAWAGLCPGQNESAGKRKSSLLRKGAPWLKTLLVQCAWAASRKKDSYYKAQFNRLRGKHGPKKGHLRRRRLDVDRDLPHPQGRRSPRKDLASTISTSASPKRRSSASSLKSLNSASKRPSNPSRKRAEAAHNGKK